MKNHHGNMNFSVLALAVAGALAQMATMPVQAEELDVKALTTPTNFVEIGAANVSQTSAKLGEYNGMNKDGLYGIGNFGVQGGDAHDGSGGTKQWEIKGKDLGLTSREFGATFSDQGKWKIGVGYDELQHNMTDSYQTPYQGSMGGNRFTLPSGFGTSANTNSLNAAQKAAFHTVDIDSTRKNTSLNAGLNINPQWDVKFDYNHLDQSGAKLMSFGSMSNGGAGGEAISILPTPTNYKTDTVNLALNWVGDKAHATMSYFGSFFRNDNDRVTFQTFNGANNIQTMSTAPGNNYNQLNLAGGYNFASKTKLVGALSYGRNTQDDTYAYDSFMMVRPSPTSSMNGVVVNTHADLKLTDQTIKDLSLSAGIKYDKRDNQTASNIYQLFALDGGHATAYPNTPLSYDKTQLELAGDYRLAKGQNVRLAYNHEDVSRWCGQYATNANYPAGTNCVVATNNRDDKLGATYKIKANDQVSLNAGYSYADRRTDSDQNARAAFSGTNVNGAPFVPGQNAGDFVGYYPFFDASRTQQIFKAGVNWEAHERLSLGLGGKYTDDQYKDSTYGVQNGNTWSVNLDATYTYSENGSVFAYVTQQHMQRDFIERTGAGAWTNQLKEDDTSTGLGFKQGGLMGGKLDLTGDVVYSLGKTGYSTQVPYLPTSATCATAAALTCGNLPDINNAMTQIKLTGNYKIDKSSRVALGYIYQRLNSSDYYYNGLQYGVTPTKLMPTNQQTGSYNVNVVSLSYIYNF